MDRLERDIVVAASKLGARVRLGLDTRSSAAALERVLREAAREWSDASRLGHDVANTLVGLVPALRDACDADLYTERKARALRERVASVERAIRQALVGANRPGTVAPAEAPDAWLERLRSAPEGPVRRDLVAGAFEALLRLHAEDRQEFLTVQEKVLEALPLSREGRDAIADASDDLDHP